jgi:hypothetical protein
VGAAHKRDVVGQFLGKELSGRTLPDKKDAICADMVHACPKHDVPELTTPCEFCQATLQVPSTPPRIECRPIDRRF